MEKGHVEEGITAGVGIVVEGMVEARGKTEEGGGPKHRRLHEPQGWEEKRRRRRRKKSDAVST